MSSDSEKMRLLTAVATGKPPTAKETVVTVKPVEVAEAETAELPMVEGLDFKQLDFNWNPDGTLSKILVEQDNETFTLMFAWNSDGTVSRITRR